MLSLNPRGRPRIGEVAARLHSVVVEAVAQPIFKLYTSICEKSKSMMPGIEQEKFKSWGWALGIFVEEGSDRHIDFAFGPEFKLSSKSYPKFESS
jgi:hypothetical protein